MTQDYIIFALLLYIVYLLTKKKFWAILSIVAAIPAIIIGSLGIFNDIMSWLS